MEQGVYSDEEMAVISAIQKANNLFYALSQPENGSDRLREWIEASHKLHAIIAERSVRAHYSEKDRF